MGLIIRQSLLMAAKDTRLFVRDRFALGFALLFPLMFVVGFSLAMGSFEAEDEQLMFTVATREEGGRSNEIIAALTESPDSDVQVMPYEEAGRALDDGELDGFVAFPSEFTVNLMAGRPTSIEVLAREGAMSKQAALEGFARALAGRISNAYTAFQAVYHLEETTPGGVAGVGMETLPELPVLISFRTEQVGDIKPVHSSNFTLPGYLTMFVFFAAALGAESIARERQTQTLERLMSNGVRRESIILGKYLGAVYKGLTQIVVLWVFGILVFRIDLGVSPAAVILVSIFMVLASSGFGVLLASFIRTQRSAGSVGVLFSLTLAPLGGCWWPLFITPDWMQVLAKVTPHAWANTGFNKLMLFGAEFGDVVPEMVALVAFGFLFLAAALWKFRLSPTR